jgi:heme exporter protein C
MKKNWWKIMAAALLLYTIWAGFLMPVPALPILHESIRNLFFHVTMWFAMIVLLTVSTIYSIKYLYSSDIRHDIVAEEAAKTGILMGVLGLITGSLWARFTWGAWWVNDTKLNGAAVTMLIYFAYLILRNSMEEKQKAARVSAVYAIFAYPMMFVFILVLPRMTVSLHPGNGGNPGFNSYDLDKNMRLVFYPAILGWTLLAVWIMSLRIRYRKAKKERMIF